VESFIILALAAGLSSIVVWWAMGHPGGRPKPKLPRRAPKATPEVEKAVDGFVLLPSQAPVPADDRPSSALSVVRLALTITLFAVLVVGALTVIGLLVKSQLDRYFSGL
jgi:hypothetical protein